MKKALDMAGRLSVIDPPIFSFAGVRECNHILTCISIHQPPSPTYELACLLLEIGLRRSFISTNGQYHELLVQTSSSSVQCPNEVNHHLASLNTNGYSTDRISESDLLCIKTVLGSYPLLAQYERQSRVETGLYRSELYKTPPEELKIPATRWFYSQRALALLKPMLLRVLGKQIEAIQSYINTKDPHITVNGWISVGHKSQSNLSKSEDAQIFHYDMDGVSFVKIFIYLTDVLQIGQGPHQFVQYSHKGIHHQQVNSHLISSCPHSRVPDKFTHLFYADAVSHFGPKGTVILEDTRGLHRGFPLEYGAYREIIVMTISNTPRKLLRERLMKIYSKC